MAKRNKSIASFESWWCSPTRRGLDPTRQSPYDIAKLAFEAGRKSIPSSPKLKKALSGVLDMLEEWDAGFDGFGEVNQAEAALGRKQSSIS